MVWLPVEKVASPFNLSVKPALLKLPATLGNRSKRKTTAPFPRLVLAAGEGALGEGPPGICSAKRSQDRGDISTNTAASIHPPNPAQRQQTRPNPPGGGDGPRAHPHRTRAGFTCGAKPQGGPAFPSCHGRRRRAASRLCGAERMTPAAVAGAPGKGSWGAVGKLGAEGGGGAARPSGRSQDSAGLCL